MGPGQFVMDNHFEDDKYAMDLLVSRFKNLGKEKFQDAVKYDLSPVDFVKICVIQYSANIAPEINDCPVTMEYVPYFWLTDLPIITYADEYFRRKGYIKLDGAATLSEIRKYYSKWALQKAEKDKQFFALSTINLVERNTNKYNFLKYVLSAIVLTYDKRISSYTKAKDFLEQAFSIVEGLDMEEIIKNEFLYQILLITGFVCIKQNESNEAFEFFSNALNYKKNGITAIIYLALLEKEFGNNDKTLNLINSVMEYDKKRFDTAIEECRLDFFNLFLNTAFIYSVFQETKFAPLITNIEYIVDSYHTNDRKFIERVSIMLSKLDDLRLKDFYTPEIKTQLQFLNDFIDKYRNNQNILVLMCSTVIEEKFVRVTKMLLDNIRQVKLAKLAENLRVYDHQVNDSNDVIKFLRKSNSEKREILSKRIEDSVKIIDEEYKEKIKVAEEIFKNVDQTEKFDTGRSFNSAMFYNIVISLMMFIIGGFGSSMISEGGLTSSMSEFIVNGIKWGGITFLIGFFVSLFTAAGTITERSNEKSRMEKKLAAVKEERELMIKQFQEEGNEKLRDFDREFRNDLEREEARLEKMRQEKNHKMNNLNDKVEEEMAQYKEMIDGVFKL